jgi:cell division protein FtsX
LKLNVERWSANSKIFSYSNPVPAVVAVRLLNYPAWHARVDGSSVAAESDAQTGQMLIRVPSGTHRVVAQFERTWDRTTGAVISLISLLFVLAIGFATKSSAMASKDKLRNF